MKHVRVVSLESFKVKRLIFEEHTFTISTKNWIKNNTPNFRLPFLLKHACLGSGILLTLYAIIVIIVKLLFIISTPSQSEKSWE